MYHPYFVILIWRNNISICSFRMVSWYIYITKLVGIIRSWFEYDLLNTHTQLWPNGTYRHWWKVHSKFSGRNFPIEIFYFQNMILNMFNIKYDLCNNSEVIWISIGWDPTSRVHQTSKPPNMPNMKNRRSDISIERSTYPIILIFWYILDTYLGKRDHVSDQW